MLKWIYNLGVQNERNRIKRLIAEFSNKVQQESLKYESFYRNETTIKKKDRRKKQSEINDRAMRVLNELIKPEVIRETEQPRIDRD